MLVDSMGSRAATDMLSSPTFRVRLDAALALARDHLHATFVGVVELAALSGPVAPRWRARTPGGELPDPTLDQFVEWLEGAPLRFPTTALPHASSTQTTSFLRLDVSPSIRAGGDALLVIIAASSLNEEWLSQFAERLTEALSSDRRDRLAHALLAAIESSADAIELSDTEARLFYVNPAWQHAFGHSREEAMGSFAGKLLRDTIDPVHNDAFYRFTMNTLASGKPWLGSLVCRNSEGERKLVEVSVAPFDAQEEGYRGHIAIRRDLAHRSARDEALAVVHREFHSVLSAIPDGVAVLRDGEVYFANPAFLTMVGREEAAVVGTPYVQFVHPSDRERFTREHERKMSRVRMLGSDATTRFAEISRAGVVSFEGQPAEVVLSRDITDYHLAREQLAHAEKLSALGSLAAGVAHEINNPLAYLVMNLEQLREKQDFQTPERTELLDEALDGARRIQRIASELHGFSASEGSGAMEAVDITKAAGSAINIALNQIRHRARLVRELEADLHALAREGQVVQVLLNVLVNAAQAIPSGSSSSDNTITVRSEALGLSRVRVSITDTGAGISEAQIPKLFQPFSTSKTRGEGAGLGLAISKRILDELAGSIRIQSHLGKGTTVTIELPRAQASGRDTTKVSGVRSMPTSSARVLVVDDELFLAKGLKRALGKDRTVIANDGTAAAEILDSDPHFDVVLCDLMMPGMSGQELYARVCARHPQLVGRFVFMTGGTFAESSQAFVQSVQAPILHKPFDLVKVLECVEAVCRKRSTA